MTAAACRCCAFPKRGGDLAMIEARAEHHREHADDVVILGTGGFQPRRAGALRVRRFGFRAERGFAPAALSRQYRPAHFRPPVPEPRPRAHRLPGHLQVGRHGRDAASVPDLPGGAGGCGRPRERGAARHRDRGARRESAPAACGIVGLLRHRPRSRHWRALCGAHARRAPAGGDRRPRPGGAPRGARTRRCTGA